MNLKGVKEIKDKEYFNAQQKELQEMLDMDMDSIMSEQILEEVNEYEQLKNNLYDLWSQLESNKIELELAVEAVGSIYRYYKERETK
jgi:hypothetical protein